MVRGFRPTQLLPAIVALAAVGDDFGPAGPLAFVGLALIVVIGRVIGWTRHTYELTGERIVERRGLLSRTERSLELARVQQVDVNRSLLDRLVGTAVLRLETASESGESEIELSVVSLEEAERLAGVADRASANRRGVARTADDGDGDGDGDDPSDSSAPAMATGSDGPTLMAESRPTERVVLEVPVAHVALATVTGRRLLLLPAGFAVLFGILDDVLPLREAREAVGDLAITAGLAAVVITLAVVAVIGIALTVVAGVLRDGNWTLVERGDALVVRRGLTTERTATVPRTRLQRVSIERSWLRGRLGFASMTVHTAGGVGGSDGGTEALDRRLAVPLLPEADVDRIVRELLGDLVDERPVLAGHPAAARRRSVLRGVAGTLPVLGLAVSAGIASGRWIAIAGWVAVAVIGAGLGALRHGKRATGLGDRVLETRTGLLGTTTVLTPVAKVQGTTITSTVFQRRRQLATLSAHVAGPDGGVVALDLASADTETMASSLRG